MDRKSSRQSSVVSRQPDGDTSFKACWDAWRRACHLPDERENPLELVAFPLAELRREALEFFSWGLVHGDEVRRILEEKLPSERPIARGRRRQSSGGYA